MNRPFSRAIAAFAILLATASTSYSQTAEKTILVLDGSGSMWGQIDGEAKITIAQRVIGDLLDSLPEGQQLGLTAYGHREKGNCQDIETLVVPGSDTRQSIRDAVNAISPKGKTPLSAAVIAAAEQLRYEEDKATVILVSDGIETCNLDPCAVGTQLEQTGVDFTAHVVGFDVSDPIALAQLQCLAENTGGRFMTATNASELAQALVEVSIQEEPEPVILEIGLNASDGVDGPIIDADLVWSLTNRSSGETILENVLTAQILQELEAGTYFAEVLRTSDEAIAELEFAAAEGGSKTLTLILPYSTPDATLEAMDTAVAGSTISVSWTGPSEKNDYISVAEVGSKDTTYVNYTYTREGNTLGLVMPPVPGNYELRYVLNNRSMVLASNPITVTEVGAALKAPQTANAGETLVIQWEGPNYKNDYVSVAKIGSADNKYINYTYTREGSALGLEMPAEPGVYEIRYVMHQDTTVIARQTIMLEVVGASITAPASADAGQELVIEWVGPNYKNDYISVAEIGSSNSKYINYTYTREGNTLTLEMPSAAGTYEIRYVQKQDQTILVRQQIELTAVSANLTVPSTAIAGESLIVTWDGPNYRNDYISVAQVGSADNKHLEYTYTRKGSPLQLQIPGAPGIYEIRYVQEQDTVILNRQTITVDAASANLVAPAAGAAGTTISVEWGGPDYSGDYISIAKIGAADNKYETYKYVRYGTPLSIELPEEAGEYELRYVMKQDTTVLARIAIQVTE